MKVAFTIFFLTAVLLWIVAALEGNVAAGVLGGLIGLAAADCGWHEIHYWWLLRKEKLLKHA